MRHGLMDELGKRRQVEPADQAESLRRNCCCWDLGSGKHSTSRQTPCGFTSKRVARLRSAVVIQSWPASSRARADVGGNVVIDHRGAESFALDPRQRREAWRAGETGADRSKHWLSWLALHCTAVIILHFVSIRGSRSDRGDRDLPFGKLRVEASGKAPLRFRSLEKAASASAPNLPAAQRLRRAPGWAWSGVVHR